MSDDAPTPGGRPAGPETLLARLTAAADDLEQKREAVKPALELRDELIIEAREIGEFSYSTIARAGRCSEGTVHAVLASH